LNLFKPLDADKYETLAESAGFAAASLDQVKAKLMASELQAQTLWLLKY